MNAVINKKATFVQLPEVYPYEFEALLQALRRDMRNQAREAQALRMSDKAQAELHSWNAHCDKRLLAILNPRSWRRAESAFDVSKKKKNAPV